MGLEIGGVDLGLEMPNFTTAGIGYWVTVISIIVLATVACGIGFWIWYTNRIYNKKIKVFENIAGAGWQHTFSDRARVMKVGDGGEELMYLRKKKVFRTAYGKKMGINTYWFAIGQDGYWYNVVLGDLDAKMGMLDIEPIDRDMRYMHVAIRKNIQERYRKVGAWEKYGTAIINFLFLIIMIVALWLLISKVGDLITEATRVVESVKPLADTVKGIAGNLDNICGGSGIKPA